MIACVWRGEFPSPRVAAAIVAAGVVFRFATLGHQSLWLDECFDVWVATTHTAQQIWSAHLDPNEPSLYYALMHWVLGWTGVSEASARLLSALSSVAGIALVWWLARSLAPGSSVARLAAALLAVAPLDVWYAQEARMHGLVGSTSLLLAIGLLVRRWWTTGLIVIGLAGGLAIDHTMWPFALILLGAWFAHWWRVGRPVGDLARVTLATGMASFIYRPVWPEAVDVFNRLHTVTVFANLRQGVGFGYVATWSFPAALIASAALSAAVAFAVLAAWRRDVSRRRLEWLLIAGFVVGTALAAIPRGYGLKQVVVGGWPVFTATAALAIASVDQRGPTVGGAQPARHWMAPLALAVSICALAVTWFTPRADWRGVASYIAARDTGTIVVVQDPPWNDLPYRYYRPGHPTVSGPISSRDALVAGRHNATEACLVAQRFGPSPPTSPSERWMDHNLPLLSTTPFARLEIRCYRLR